MNHSAFSSPATAASRYKPLLDFHTFHTRRQYNIPDISVPVTQNSLDSSPRFAAALAHEVRNPLTNINLSVDMLNAVVTDNELKIYIDIISRSSMRINHLMSELLKSREIDAAPTSIYSLHQLLDNVLTLTEDRIMLKKVRVRKQYAAEDFKICIDKPNIMIAITNIIINAIEAMTERKGELTLLSRSIGNKYVIEIADNGAGISKEHLKRIFRPHFTNKPGGMGLGLSTTLEILQHNQVGVDVRSEEGQGTCFILFFEQAI